ncbi:hypothetical protein Hanom_Chr04g00379601 [Helianthus anomalus]
MCEGFSLLMSIYGTLLLIVDGAVEIPYISDENADEDPDLRDIVKMRVRLERG